MTKKGKGKVVKEAKSHGEKYDPKSFLGPGEMPAGMLPAPRVVGESGLFVERQRLKRQMGDTAQAEVHKARHVIEASEKKKRARLLKKIADRSEKLHDTTVERCWRREELNETIIQTDEVARADEIAEVFTGAENAVAQRMAGDHIFKDTPGDQRAQIYREPSLYEEGVEMFNSSKEMVEDYGTMRVGDVAKVKLTALEKRKKAETMKKLEKFRKLEAVREKTNAAKKIQQDKVTAAEGAAFTVREMSEKLATSGKSMSFEARAKARRKLLAQKEIADALSSQADEATMEFLEVKRRLNTSGADENEAWLSKITGADNERTAFESGTGVKVGVNSN
jgi:hypothetical protein